MVVLSTSSSPRNNINSTVLISVSGWLSVEKNIGRSPHLTAFFLTLPLPAPAQQSPRLPTVNRLGAFAVLTPPYQGRPEISQYRKRQPLCVADDAKYTRAKHRTCVHSRGKNPTHKSYGTRPRFADFLKVVLPPRSWHLRIYTGILHECVDLWCWCRSFVVQTV